MHTAPVSKMAPATKASLDPFEQPADEVESQLSEDDFMLEGGMQLLNKPKMNDYVGQMAEKCVDLNQFISKMDELVQQHYNN